MPCADGLLARDSPTPRINSFKMQLADGRLDASFAASPSVM
jgi:hypothetical protein